MPLRKVIRGADLFGEGWSARLNEALISINAAEPDLYIYVERFDGAGKVCATSLHTVSLKTLRKGPYPIALEGVCIVLHYEAPRSENGRNRMRRLVLAADTAPPERGFTRALGAGNVPAI